ncbi:hypothetical protein [Streptomyces sp. NPDC047841]|uniref:hypothetical protein n=1 Tax=Streptomyces sp. NPDC047841 TaxID=3154708 RepID=UPI003453C82C
MRRLVAVLAALFSLTTWIQWQWPAPASPSTSRWRWPTKETTVGHEEAGGPPAS